MACSRRKNDSRATVYRSCSLPSLIFRTRCSASTRSCCSTHTMAYTSTVGESRAKRKPSRSTCSTASPTPTHAFCTSASLSCRYALVRSSPAPAASRASASGRTSPSSASTCSKARSTNSTNGCRRINCMQNLRTSDGSVSPSSRSKP